MKAHSRVAVDRGEHRRAREGERAQPVASTGKGVIAGLMAATATGSLGLGAGGTAGALVAARMTGGSATAGLPLGILVVGSAAGALLIAQRTRRASRTAALALGYLIGAAGALLVIAAVAAHSFGGLLCGSFLLGAANAAVTLTRYAAVDAAAPAARGRALGAVFAATAVGAVASVFLLGPSGGLAAALGLPRLAGLYVLAAAAFPLAALTLTALGGRRRPARAPRTTGPATGGPRTLRRADLSAALAGRETRLALLLLAVSNLSMAAVMAVVPVHLHALGHDLALIGAMTGAHVLCMFGPSPLTGWLADRVGAIPVAVLGLTALAVAGVLGAAIDARSGLAATAFLAVLGAGWNAGVVGGSALLAASVPAATRPRAEGYGEVAMGLAAGAGAPAAGLLLALGGFTPLCLLAALTAVLTALTATLAAARRGTHAVAM